MIAEVIDLIVIYIRNLFFNSIYTSFDYVFAAIWEAISMHFKHNQA